MKSKINFVIAASLAVLLLFAFQVSASGMIMSIQDVHAPASVNPGQDATITFALNSSATESGTVQSTYTIDWSDTKVTNGVIKSSPSVTSIKTGEQKNVTMVVTAPKFSSEKIGVSLSSKVSGNNVVMPGPSAKLDILVNNTPSLSVVALTPLSLGQNGSINVSNTGNTPLTSIVLSVSGNTGVSLSESRLSLNAGESNKVDVRISSTATNTFGSSSVSILAKDTNTNVQSSISFDVRKSLCRSGPQGTNLSIREVNINNEDGDDTDWMPLNKVSVEVEVENNGNDDIKDVQVSMVLMDGSGKTFTNKLDFDDSDKDKKEISRISDGDTENVKFSFTVPGDFDEGSYRLSVKAFSKKISEDLLCVDSSSDLDNTIYQSIDVTREDDEGKFIAFDNIRMSPSEATCGDSVTMTLDVYNVGTDDQERVKVKLYNKDLKIDTFQELKNDFDAGDKETISLNFLIPQNIKDGTYSLDLSSEYDFDKGNYRESSDDSTKTLFKVFGCSAGIQVNEQSKALSISASLESEAIAGKKMIVKSTVKNNGQTPLIGVVNVKGNEDWADLESVSERVLNLAPGQSKEITLTFNVKESASGKNTFNLEVNAGEGNVSSQEVEVTLAQSRNLLDFSGNGIIWVIGIINVILIVIIIVVAVKIAQR